MKVGVFGEGPRADALAAVVPQLRAGTSVVRSETEFLEPLDSPDLAAVVWVLPLALRGKWIQRSLARGLPVWVDGLPCQSVEGARRLGALVESHGGSLWCHNRLDWEGGLRYLAGLVESQALGRPLYLRGHRSGLGSREGDVFWEWAVEDLGAVSAIFPDLEWTRAQGMATGEGARDFVQETFEMGEWMVSLEWNRLSPQLRHQWWVVGTRRAALLDFLDEETPLRIMEWEKSFKQPPKEPTELLENGKSQVPLWVPEVDRTPGGRRSLEQFLSGVNKTAAPTQAIRWVSQVAAIHESIVHRERREPDVESLELF